MHDIEHCLFKQSEVGLVENKNTLCPVLALIMHPVPREDWICRYQNFCVKLPLWIGHFLNENSNSLKLLRGLSAQKQPWQSCMSSRGPVRQALFCLMSLQFSVSKFIKAADTAYVTKICYLWTLALPINYAWQSRQLLSPEQKG